MTFSIRLLSAFVLMGFFMSAPSSADAMCRGKQHIQLSDGSSGCVVRLTKTEVSSTQGVQGVGGSTNRVTKAESGFLVVNMLNEKAATGLSRNKLRRRAIEICKRMEPALLNQIARPAHIASVIALTWGPNPKKTKLNYGPTVREFFMTKGCYVKSSK